MLSAVYAAATLFLLECLQTFTGSIDLPNAGTAPLCRLSPYLHVWNANGAD